MAKATGVDFLELNDGAAGKAAKVVGAEMAGADKAAEVFKVANATEEAAGIEAAEAAGAKMAMAAGTEVLEDIVCIWDDLTCSRGAISYSSLKLCTRRTGSSACGTVRPEHYCVLLPVDVQMILD